VEIEHAEESEPTEHNLRLWTRGLNEVREMAEGRSSSSAPRSTRYAITRQRSEAVRVYVLRRANGTCEACRRPAPFATQSGRAYLEPHHIHRCQRSVETGQ
jgi:5-methylcytosine-specific restriction protein A